MRSALVAILALIFTPLATASGDAASRIFDYECKQVDPKQFGFSCDGFKKGGDGPWFTWHRAPRDMPKEEGKRAAYEFDKFLFRYLELGGKNFYVRRAEWPKPKHMACMGTGKARYTCRTFCPDKPDWKCE